VVIRSIICVSYVDIRLDTLDTHPYNIVARIAIWSEFNGSRTFQIGGCRLES
jgi:hypothetical protein